MLTRTSLLIFGATLAGAAPALAETTPPTTMEAVAKNRPMKRLPVDGSTPDSLLPPVPQPVLAPSAQNGSTLPNYAARERDARELEQFRGGEGVSLYIGGGVLTAIAIVALLVILL